MRSASSSPEAGFGLVLTLFGMALAVLTLGAGIDLSHISLVRNELQGAVDEVALSAARELDGTWHGLERARRIAERTERDRQRWFAFSTDRVSELTVGFATAQHGPWEKSPKPARGYRFVRIAATAEARLFFMPMVPGAPRNQNVAVQSVAGQHRLVAREPDHSLLTVAVAGPVQPGAKVTITSVDPAGCAASLKARLQHDTDSLSVTYEDYVARGNGQRILAASVPAAADRPETPRRYLTLLVQPANVEAGECAAACVGDAPVLTAKVNGAGPPGLYEVRLFR
jgi:hypothetical protein